jgi:hypothetical protein
MFVADFYHGVGETKLAVHKMEVEATAVTHPRGVDVIVVAWCLAVKGVATSPNLHVAATTTPGTDTGRLRQKPNTLLEAEIGAGQRPNRTYIDGIERVIVLQPLAGMHCESGMAATLSEAEHGLIGDLSSEADATAAHDAALVIEAHTWADVHILRLLDLVLTEAAFAFAMLDAELLQTALTSLIADRAVERMID